MTASGLLTTLPPLATMDQVSDAQLALRRTDPYADGDPRPAAEESAAFQPTAAAAAGDGRKDFEEYYHRLTRLPPQDPEWDAFLQEITTHETYLFRDQAHWEWLRNVYLPERSALARRTGGLTCLRIWSAACSTGDEAVTAACCIAACLPDFQRWQIRILGTDIGVGAVEQARTAAFGPRAMQLVPEEYCRRFFSKGKESELWQARPMITDMLTFRQHNLIEPLREKPFDLVLLKNVLIYFSKPSKATVLHNVRAAVRPGGFLMLGAAEGVADLLQDFQRLEPWLYRKPVS